MRQSAATREHTWDYLVQTNDGDYAGKFTGSHKQFMSLLRKQFSHMIACLYWVDSRTDCEPGVIYQAALSVKGF